MTLQPMWPADGFVERTCLPAIGVVLAVLIALSAGSARADDCAGALSATQIAACLKSTPGQGDAARGLRVMSGAPMPQHPAANLVVNFGFDSAELTADGAASLDALGHALKDPELANGRYEIAGHTDAVGSDEVNQSLSEQRAQAVKTYLVAHFGVPADHFLSVGYGKTRLLDPDHPTDAVNRRVQITRLSD